MHPAEPLPPGDELIPVSENENFAFRCSSALACFNSCCRDLNQFLTPYDILQLKTFLGIRSTEFLAKYTSRHIGPQTGLPVVSLRPKAGGERQCPFVTPAGCAVYPNRPSSCRMYPLARAASRCRKSGRLTQHFALIREPHCLGFQQNHCQSVGQWIQNQRLQHCLEHNDRFLEIIAIKNQMAPGPLDLRSQHLFQLALYDIDAFREHILYKGLLADGSLPEETLQRLEIDDLELLLVGHRFVAHQLVGKTPAFPGAPPESGQPEGRRTKDSDS